MAEIETPPPGSDPEEWELASLVVEMARGWVLPESGLERPPLNMPLWTGRAYALLRKTKKVQRFTPDSQARLKALLCPLIVQSQKDWIETRTALLEPPAAPRAPRRSRIKKPASPVLGS